MKNLQDEERLFRKRARTGFLVILVLTLGLAARYVYLQVLQHDDFATRSESNRVHVRAVAPNRGLIYDRRGRVVAENRPAYRIELVPEK
ncbi:MAG: penicillin-binding protein 2, partial [Gammaproteobacteria bacterium]|nr:penicillin-binding protein 2 [Gammaproteobacteria bacterium]